MGWIVLKVLFSFLVLTPSQWKCGFLVTGKHAAIWSATNPRIGILDNSWETRGSCLIFEKLSWVMTRGFQ